MGRVWNSKTGIELEQSFPLLTSHVNPLKQLSNQLQGQKNQGDIVVTTLNAKLQQIAYDALGNQKGAVVAIEPSTGKILAMVSKRIMIRIRCVPSGTRWWQMRVATQHF